MKTRKFMFLGFLCYLQFLTISLFINFPVCSTTITTEFPVSEPSGTAEPISEPNGTAEPVSEPSGTAEPTAEPSGTAEPTSEPSGTAEPVSEPNGTAEPASEPSGTAEPASEPSGTAEPAAEPSGTAEPSAEPSGTAEPTPEPSGTAEPVSEPNGTAEPASEPSGTAEPASEPSGTAEPAAEPSGTAEPSAEPSGTAEPTPEPSGTAEPVSEPNGTAEPASEPSGTAEPASEPSGTAEPGSEPSGTAEPASEPNGTAEPASEPSGTAEPASEPNGTADPVSELNGTAEPDAEVNVTSEPTSEPEVNEPVSEVRPSSAEILLPPLLLCAAIIGALIWLVIARYKPCSRSYRRVWVSSLNKAKLRSVFKMRPSLTPNQKVEKEQPPLLTAFDLEVIASLKTFYNKPRELVRIALPAVLSLALCPITLYMYAPLIEVLWPPEERVTFPDINDAIACFLSPAGLVYATSFGFAFQQALSKQHEVLVHVTEELSKIDQIATLTNKISLPTIDDRLEIYRSIKAEIIFMILQIEQRETSSFFFTPNEDTKVKIWGVLDILRKVPVGDKNAYMDRIMCEKIVSHITCINSICSDRMGTIHSRIHPLKWAFLETLGFFSFLGVLLLQAGGYRMELAMCIITVFSISMLCYVVSDLDSPFSGFFRVDLSVFPDVVSRLDTMYHNAVNGDLSVTPYPEPQRATKQKKHKNKIQTVQPQDKLQIKNNLSLPLQEFDV